MWRSKKFILITALVVAVLAGSIGGVALAQTEDEDNGQAETQRGAILDRVCEIYEENTGIAIDSQELRNAINQARSEIMTGMRGQFRQRLIDEGVITQEQLDELEAWLESRPDFPTDEFKEWLESRPDVSFGKGAFGHGKHRGFGQFGDRFSRTGGFCLTQDS